MRTNKWPNNNELNIGNFQIYEMRRAEEKKYGLEFDLIVGNECSPNGFLKR